MSRPGIDRGPSGPRGGDVTIEAAGVPLYRRIAKRYTRDDWADGYVDGTADQPRALCAVRLDAPTTRIRTWRMPIAGEDPRGIWHPRYYV